MTWSVSSCFITLGVLFLWRVDEIADACSCMVVHPQQAFCNADVVIRARVVGVEAGTGNTKYDIQQVKMIKGSNRDIRAIFTGGPCRTTLEVNKMYFFTGRLKTDGTVHVIMCDFIQSWEPLSDTQIRFLTLLYQSSCNCKIIRCNSLPCLISAPDECLWLDNGQSRTWAKNVACIKGGDGSCAWYRGMAHPNK